MISQGSTKAGARAPRPCFIPSGVEFTELPQELRAAIMAVLDPAYRQLVLEPGDALTRSAGLTVVHLLWLELLDQFELGRGAKDARQFGTDPDRAKLIDRHLRLIGAKAKTSHLLLRLREHQQRWGAGMLPSPTDPTGLGPVPFDPDAGEIPGGPESGDFEVR